MPTITLPPSEPAHLAAPHAAFVSSFGMVPGETEVELARILALFFQDPPESGLLDVRVIQTADGRIGERLVFDSAESLQACFDSIADRRGSLLQRLKALTDPASVPVMWMGSALDIPDTLWPDGSGGSCSIDTRNDQGQSASNNPTSSSSLATHTIDPVVNLDAADQPLRARSGASELFDFMTFWNPTTMGQRRARRRDDAPGCTVLLSGLPGRVTGAGYFTRFVHNFTLPSRRLQHAPYLAVPLQITSYPQPPQLPRRTLCLTATLETGATVRCKFDSASVACRGVPTTGLRILVRVPSLTPAMPWKAAGDDVTAPSPLPPLRSATVRAVSSWSRKRAVDACVPVVERLWASPHDDEHDRVYVAPLAAFALAVARDVVSGGNRLALCFDEARAFHDLSGIVLMVGLAQRAHATRRGDLELQLAHVAREVQYRVGAPVHWAPVASR